MIAVLWLAEPLFEVVEKGEGVMRSHGKIIFSGVLAIAAAGFLFSSRADDETSAEGAAFAGKVTKVDKSAQTLIVNKQTYHVLPTTQITRSGKPATINDIKTGEQ